MNLSIIAFVDGIISKGQQVPTWYVSHRIHFGEFGNRVNGRGVASATKSVGSKQRSASPPGGV
jgi:hypothetical protein